MSKLINTPNGQQLTVEGNYAVDTGGTLDTYLLVPVCGNCLQPIFPQFPGCEEHLMHYNSRGTDEPSECDLCVSADAEDEDDVGTTYDARTVPTMPEQCQFCNGKGIPPDTDDGEQVAPKGLACPVCGTMWKGTEPAVIQQVPQCQCCNEEHEDGQCPHMARYYCQPDNSPPLIVYICEECLGGHVPTDEYDYIPLSTLLGTNAEG